MKKANPMMGKEKKLEKALKGYRRESVKLAKKVVEDAKATDDEVADEVAKVILETACLNPREQFEAIEKTAGADYVFTWMLCAVDMWPIIDIANRLMHDEAAARECLCKKFYKEGNVHSKVLCSRIRSGKFIHFQMTRSFTGGMDAYIVFRAPQTRSAAIIRICYK